MPEVTILILGVAIGYVARRYAFCIFGSVVELLRLGSTRRLMSVVSAMLVFGLVQMGQYEHGVEHPGLQYLIGGMVQGVGYYLAVGCPLSLLIRIGEGSKFHLVVFVSFVVGVALYVGALENLVSRTLARASFTEAVTVVDLFGG
jgi:uncharacterized membrane protein YedE/YeeE